MMISRHSIGSSCCGKSHIHPKNSCSLQEEEEEDTGSKQTSLCKREWCKKTTQQTGIFLSRFFQDSCSTSAVTATCGPQPSAVDAVVTVDKSPAKEENEIQAA